MQWPLRKGIERVYRRSEKASQMLRPVMVQSLFSLRLEVVMQNLNITPNLGFVQWVAFSLRSWLIWNQKAGRKIQAMSQQYPLALPISLIPACSGGKELALSADERWNWSFHRPAVCWMPSGEPCGQVVRQKRFWCREENVQPSFYVQILLFLTRN